MNSISDCFPVGSEKRRVAFADFSSDFDTKNSIFSDVLRFQPGVEFTDELTKADVLIHSVFGATHRSFQGTRVFYTGESVMPRWNECDYALTFLREEPVHPERHFRLPYWVFADYIRRTGRVEQYSTNPADVFERHRKFCNFMYSNANAKERVHFLHALSRYRHVDSSGRFLNNTGGASKNKVEFCSGYKFTIAFENYAAKGYVTEKLADAFAAGSLPIYWGAPDVGLDFNPRRFVNARDFKDFHELTEYIRYLDGDDAAYLEYFKGPLFLKGQKCVDDFRDGLDLFLRKALAEGVVRNPGECSVSGCSQHYERPDMPEYDDGKPWKREVKEAEVSPDVLGAAPLRVAVCLSSYKRVEDFIRQVFCMMNQSYSNLHVFAALKGVPRPVAEAVVFPTLQPFLDAGRLTLRLFPNKDQFTNFLDTVRGVDVSEYDLFAKIDDDDFYHRDYFRNVHDFHARLPAGYSSCYDAPGNQFRKVDGFSLLKKVSPLCMGPALVMSRRVMMEMLELEDSPERMREALKECRSQTGFSLIGFAEDQFFKFMMLKYGCGNIARYLEKQGIRHHLTIQASNHSVTRGGSLSEDFRKRNWVMSDNPANHEYVVNLKHPHWEGYLLIFNGRARRLDCGNAEATVIFLSDQKLVLKWDRWGQEIFVRESEGVYRLQQLEELAEVPTSCTEKEAVGEETVCLRHPVWRDSLRICGNRGQRVKAEEGCMIPERTERVLALDWDHWEQEEFVLRNDGQYWFSPYACQIPDTQEKEEEWIIDLLDRPGKSWLGHTGRPTLHLRYASWDILARMEQAKRDMLRALEDRPEVKRVLVTGICKDSLPALYLAMEIRRFFPSMRAGVLGCPWTGNSSEPELRTGLFWPQEMVECYRKGGFDLLFHRYGDAVKLWQEERRLGLGVRGYAFHAESDLYRLDRGRTRRVEPFLHKVFTVFLGREAVHEEVHLQAPTFLRRRPEAFRKMIDMLFEDLRQPGPDGECCRYRVQADGIIGEEGS